jgi:hypothetical protein
VSGAWVNWFETNSIFNTNNKITSWLQQEWNDTIWVNFQISTYTYDANNLTKSQTFKKFNTAGTAITDGDSIYYSFHTATGINNFTAQEGNITIYPNPFTTQTRISFDKDQKNTSIKIIDVLGKEIKTVILSGAKNLIIEKGEMRAGIYFVQVIDANKNVMNRKIVVQ